jgi:4-hydroxyproline epimerase
VTAAGTSVTGHSAPRIRVVDSHTGGEPTRVVIDGGPLLDGPFVDRVRALRAHHDRFRSAVVNEPRGSDVLVGALLTPPVDPTCAAGLIFFNNVGYLGMCGHGTIGAVVTLAWLGRLTAGEHRIETPVGIVTTHLHDAHTVSVRNVPAYRHAHGVRVDVDGLGTVTGDVAWGGNWFFLIDDHGQKLELAHTAELAAYCDRVMRALARAGITGAKGAPIDHVELSAGSRNFVLCPGGAYDRSPCGTGTSAKLACLAAEGRLAPGEVWRQQSITGSWFEGRYEIVDGALVPTITGQAWVNAEATLILDPDDPHRDGIRGT